MKYYATIPVFENHEEEISTNIPSVFDYFRMISSFYLRCVRCLLVEKLIKEGHILFTFKMPEYL